MNRYLENAVISDCGKYRYLLRRAWDRGRHKELRSWFAHAGAVRLRRDDFWRRPQRTWKKHRRTKWRTQ